MYLLVLLLLAVVLLNSTYFSTELEDRKTSTDFSVASEDVFVHRLAAVFGANADDLIDVFLADLGKPYSLGDDER